MRKMAMLVLVGVLWLSAFGLAEEGSLFAQANAKYAAGDFAASAVLYEEMLRSGHETSVVYFNLGNAYFRTGQKGKAMLAFERARRLAPRDADILWNIGVLRSLLMDRLEAKPANPFLYYTMQWLDRVSMGELAASLTGILLFYLLLAGVAFFWLSFKNGSVALRFLVFLALIFVSCAAGLKTWHGKDPTIVVREKEVMARYGPSSKETAAFVLHEGSSARVLDEVNDWYYIALPNQNAGWIPKTSCERV